MFNSKRLVFRAFNFETDYNTLVQWQYNDEWREFMTSAPLTPPSSEWMKNLYAERAPTALPMFAVCLKPETWPLALGPDDNLFKAVGPPIGVLNFMPARFDFKNRSCELAIGMSDPKHRGQGYGKEIIEWAFEYGFDQLALHRIALLSYSFNSAAIKLWRKVGMTEEGRLRKIYLRHGEWYDGVQFSILEEEYFSRRGMA
ncbi:hypothetical protein LTR78_010025 [Recurvomyces mirabilis]|uniref:N-acetyltransferase domain-containing protein n=1 Tax=Recurvomyces mirabilis TaxID=574656 RepID=A0AAE0TNI3_9PEZI|nr:hypothetical protein LTR78_010025 [Recurvomyces mirabilis]KAK5149806.1 hypothetical protein LTS14_010627 [Recurvomyces mirabilis]